MRIITFLALVLPSLVMQKQVGFTGGIYEMSSNKYSCVYMLMRSQSYIMLQGVYSHINKCYINFRAMSQNAFLLIMCP